MNSSSFNAQNKTKKIAVIGSGVWGLAISRLLARNENQVNVLSQFEDEADTINKDYPQLLASTNFESTIKDCSFIFIVVPSNAVLSVLKTLSQNHISLETRLIICTKGIDSEGLRLFSDCIEYELPKVNYAILAGPNFAGEVAESLPTTTTIASKDRKTAIKFSSLLENENFLPVISDDIVSAQIFGSIKNILAIGCGIIDGMNLGENAKAALVLKGILEAESLINKLGGNTKESFISPCGLGDLFLTCSSKKSRNNTLGTLIGKGKKIEDILASKITYEGFNASESMIKFAKKHQTTLPLCQQINHILQSNFSIQEIKSIISKAVLSH
ncbi:MAG: glycerol-3-phosphate dehydrogenase (NAD(P)+) [Rickettsiales bacterium]|jgi:glycerol-3-phosphate dehydrogenase (NAD(P)+)